MKTRKKNEKRGLKAALCFLMCTWIILLVLLIAIFLLKLGGYQTFGDWWGEITENAEPVQGDSAPTEVPRITSLPPATETPAPTKEPVYTVTPEPTPEPTPTPVDKDETMETIESYHGATIKEYGLTDTEYYKEGKRSTLLAIPFLRDERLDEEIREEIGTLLNVSGERLDRFETENPNKETMLIFDYDCFWNDNFISFVYHIIEETGTQRKVSTVPSVYRLDTKERVQGGDLFKESYFAILKERLMKEVVKYLPEGTEDAFCTYEEPYHAEDFAQFYVKWEKVIFYFPENTLTDTPHEPFFYETELAEAEPFMKYTFAGESTNREIRELDPDKKMIALTFDDGPYPAVEKRLLEMLEQYGARATFFSVGDRITGSYKTMLRDLYNAGHEIGSHANSHIYLKNESKEVFWQEINKSVLKIASVTGHAPDYIRMPGGQYTDYMQYTPMPMVNWRVDSRDWENKKAPDKADQIFEKVTKELKDGDIVLMHSLYHPTADAVEQLLIWMEENGYQAVTLTELFYYKGITPKNGVKYSKGR